MIDSMQGWRGPDRKPFMNDGEAGSIPSDACEDLGVRANGGQSPATLGRGNKRRYRSKIPYCEERTMTEGDRAAQFRIPELVDIATVAMLLGVGERYVRRLVAERQIEIVKVGHYVRFDLQIVRKWVEDRRRPAAGTPGRGT
jgi:excisionase family DNA binding protein